MFGNERNSSYSQIAIKVCPLLALIFSVLVTIVTLYIYEGISPPFIFISIQVYLNWYSICTISRGTMTMQNNSKQFKYNSVAINMNSINDSPPKLKYWYCEKCFCYTYKPTQHCGACKKCFHSRDHHCFFIGGCIIQQNMGNFILICFYTSLACLYSLSVVGPYLYDNLKYIVNLESSVFNIVLNFCFPIAFARLVVAGETSCLLLITLFNILFSVCVLCLIYGSWKLFNCLTGRQRYYPHVAKKQSIQEIFGNHGIYNFLFPYNGLRDSKDIHGNYELKEI
ncbi:hypothetical protein PV327_005972 [Microctonus hyperodae]|uniref:Palmitoyltransferase n=1 Tax=Microctonus hyperodae TaxID=165561 RepID=A0AA39G2S8_MICHY|nr:hypothetical protein PV327_005972 [Microctonus hyperodae]